MRLKRNELPLGLILALGLWLVVWFGSYARSIRGVVKERSGEVMAGVLVSIRDASDAPVAFVRSGSDGRYAIECADSLAVGYNLVFSFLGFKPLSIPVAKAVDGGEIVMEESSINLKEVVVRVPPIKSRGDRYTDLRCGVVPEPVGPQHRGRFEKDARNQRGGKRPDIL